MGAKQAGTAFAIIALANVVATYFFGHLGGILRRKYLLSVLYLIRAAMALFVLLQISELSIYSLSRWESSGSARCR